MHHLACDKATTGNRMTNLEQAKPFPITKIQVWEAYKRVKANGGAAGVDQQTLEDFAGDYKGNLYKLWNRMASGSYMPPPVKRVEIPKATGGTRPLGVPTVADRIAQSVIKAAIEPRLEKCFHPDSFGYRPGKSAKQALEKTRQRCWQYDWVLEYDISQFFEDIDHERLMKAVRKHVEEKWILLYIERWLKAPTSVDGVLSPRTRGTPQGGVVSPILANLYLHYCFDQWISRHHPGVVFERYADDGVVHCATYEQALQLKLALEQRFSECGLKLHPTKTRIIYCKQAGRSADYPDTAFDFLGYTFRPRGVKSGRGEVFVGFTPAVSNTAAKAIRREIRNWGIPRRTDKKIDDLARMFNAKVRGWTNYYGAFTRSVLCEVLRHLDRKLVLWVTRKYKKFRGHRARAREWLWRVESQHPNLFAHCEFLHGRARMGGAG